ncbi:PWWP domain-containing DNA repair factor 3A [Dendropsophus ebraccatus]|uniref:PWWP domain-containing DNA repair factor 3A n=1 Tax=Dendropsophus ebraccatus TaxID=150705 RepID=UPI0038319E51
MANVLKIEEVLERTKKIIITTEDRKHEKALKSTADKNKSRSTGTRIKRASDQKETTTDKKGTSPKQSKTKVKTKGSGKGSKTKLNNSGAAISIDALENSTSFDSEVSPTKHSTAQKPKRSLHKRPNKALGGEQTVCDDVSCADDRKSEKEVTSNVPKQPFDYLTEDSDSLTVSPPKKRQKRIMPHSVPRRLGRNSKSYQDVSTDLQTESSEADTEKGNGHSVDRSSKQHMPDFEEEKVFSSELSMEMSSPESPALPAVSPSHDDTEEDIQLPVVVLQKEPAAILRGSFVWCKFQHYPYWPSLVKSVDLKHKKASVIFLGESISDPTEKKKSFKVAFRSIKHYDCPEKQQLLENARKDFGKSIDWCDSLISDYRIRMGCGSFSGSFIEYCTADISLPVRREQENGKRAVIFPVLGPEVTEDQQEEVGLKSQVNRKLLPDRARAARDRANEKLVDFIVKNKLAENHLLDILTGKKKSEWLKKYKSSNRRINCLETYIEDEQQIEIVVGYLQTVCKKMSSASKKLMLGDQTQFIFEVLIPEAVIFAISATEQMSYKKAEEKYLKGPTVTKRERKIFEEQILEKKRFKQIEDGKIKKDSRK